MLFTSLEYIFFLPMIAVLYYVLSHRVRWILLLGASYFFYAFWRFDFLILVVLSTLIDYIAGLQMAKHAEKRDRKKWLYLSLFINLGLLFVFKYLGFFNEEVRHLFQLFDLSYSVPEFDILLPIGISFYTFQTLSYTLDIYRSGKAPERHLGYFALYVSFFPQLIAGPIERASRLIPQFRTKQTFNWVNISEGARLFLWGMFKKIIIADYLILFFKPIMDQPELFSGGHYILAMFAATVWIYADFSGYTDMAIGSARFFGIRLVPNFRRPYFAESISELWQRWHISLTSWINDYFFRPLVRKAKSKWARYAAIVLIFLAIGFWHKASWNLLAFGLLHGMYIIINRVTKRSRRKFMDQVLKKTSVIRISINVLLTFLFWTYSSALFVSDSLSHAWHIMTHLFVWDSSASLLDVPGVITVEYIVMAIGTSLFLYSEIINKKIHENPFDSIRFTGIRWSFYLAMIFLLIVFGHQVNNEFFYFQF
ncbi:MAG: alginate O-acetyltransferase complex protein AlgI [Crocinitomicaceae bacterium]|jgi:alginate O-acetyltransferase complex protein AlgI